MLQTRSNFQTFKLKKQPHLLEPVLVVTATSITATACASADGSVSTSDCTTEDRGGPTG